MPTGRFGRRAWLSSGHGLLGGSLLGGRLLDRNVLDHGFLRSASPPVFPFELPCSMCTRTCSLPYINDMAAGRQRATPPGSVSRGSRRDREFAVSFRRRVGRVGQPRQYARRDCRVDRRAGSRASHRFGFASSRSLAECRHCRATVRKAAEQWRAREDQDVLARHFTDVCASIRLRGPATATRTISQAPIALPTFAACEPDNLADERPGPRLYGRRKRRLGTPL